MTTLRDVWLAAAAEAREVNATLIAAVNDAATTDHELRVLIRRRREAANARNTAYAAALTGVDPLAIVAGTVDSPRAQGAAGAVEVPSEDEGHDTSTVTACVYCDRPIRRHSSAYPWRSYDGRALCDIASKVTPLGTITRQHTDRLPS